MNQGLATVIAAVIAVIGVCLTVIVTIIVNKKSTYNHSVTIKREEWLNRFRDDIGDLFAGFYILEYTKHKKYNNDQLKILSKAESARAKIIVRLKEDGSIGNERNLELKSCLNEFSFNNKKALNYIENYKKRILMYSSEILIREWAKIKKESK